MEREKNIFSKTETFFPHVKASLSIFRKKKDANDREGIEGAGVHIFMRDIYQQKYPKFLRQSSTSYTLCVVLTLVWALVIEEVIEDLKDPVPSKDMHSAYLPPLFRRGHIYMKETHSAESNEKSCIRFLYFELWLIVFTIYGGTTSVSLTKKKVFQK